MTAIAGTSKKTIKSANMLIHLISYFLFFSLLLIAKKRKVNRLIKEDGALVASVQLLLLQAAGILLMGILPFLSTNSVLPMFLRTANLLSTPALLSVLLSAGVLLVAPHLSAKMYTETTSMQQPKNALSLAFITGYLFLRTLFIAAYEIWFRGFLLVDSIDLFGIPIAVSLNIALYTLLHLVNGKQEVLGCIPFGLLLCALCLWQGAVWPAVVLHLALTLSYEGTLLQKQKFKTLPHENLSHRRIRVHRG